MKLVFTADEVAAALQKSTLEFAKLRPNLEALGFPLPVRGLEDRWAIMDVINWVNQNNDSTRMSDQPSAMSNRMMLS